MTREEAIKHLCTYSSTNGSGLTTDKQHEEAKRLAIQALEQTQFADGDRAISLNAVKDLFCKICMENNLCYRSKETCEDLRLFDKLPPVNPCEDAISREEVLLMIDSFKDNYGSLIDLAREVRELSSVNS